MTKPDNFNLPLKTVELGLEPDNALLSVGVHNMIPPHAKKFLTKVRDLILPPQCMGCSCILEQADTLCSKCWSNLSIISGVVCQTCGMPFPHDQFAILCAPCAGHTPPFARARGAVEYDDGSRSMILAFKYADRTEAARLFARMMITAAADMISDADILVPVPLDPKRLFHRRYNQAALIAQSISKQRNVIVYPDAMERIKPTPDQNNKKTKITPAQRHRNVQGAFRVRDTYKDRLKGQRILVVDDVYTTGATAWSMAKQLNRNGVKAVDVLTFARVVNSDS